MAHAYAAQMGQVLQPYAADGHYRQRYGTQDLLEDLEAPRGSSGAFCGGGEHWTEADVVGLGGCLDGLGKRMGGPADDGVGTQLAARRHEVAIVLTEVQAVGIRGQRRLEVVVHDDADTARAKVFHERETRSGSCSRGPVLRPELDDLCTAVRKLDPLFDGIAESSISDSIEAGSQCFRHACSPWFAAAERTA